MTCQRKIIELGRLGEDQGETIKGRLGASTHYFNVFVANRLCFCGHWIYFNVSWPWNPCITAIHLEIWTMLSHLLGPPEAFATSRERQGINKFILLSPFHVSGKVSFVLSCIWEMMCSAVFLFVNSVFSWFPFVDYHDQSIFYIMSLASCYSRYFNTNDLFWLLKWLTR